MQKKLDLAYEVINEFVQWFLYHNFYLDENIQAKMDAFFDCEVTND